MLGRVIDTYFSKVPTVLCAGEGTVAAENDSAKALLPALSPGHSLLSHMAPYDALRFETACDRSFGAPLYFPLQSCGDFTYAAAAFETLTDRCFAAVSLFSDGERGRAAFSAPPEHAPSREKYSAFAKILGACDFPAEESDGLFDLRAVTVQVLQDAASFCAVSGRGVSVSFHDETAEGSVVLPSAIGVGNYMRLLMSAVAALDERAAGGDLAVRLLQSGGCHRETVLRLSARADPEKCAAREGCDGLSLCAFFAKCLPVTFASDFDSASGILELSLTLAASVTEEVDLKSRDPMQGYEALFAHIASLLRRLR